MTEIKEVQRKLIADAIYMIEAVERTAKTISRGPNGKKARIRFLSGATPAKDMIVNDLLTQVREATDKGTIEAE